LAEHPEREARDRDGGGRAPWSYRGPEDDFRCLRFRVWYPSKDCAIRTKFKTSPGCLDCDQGRFNLKRHAPALRGVRVFVSVESA
jgi:hypothetical protein